jgi:hypothetical protein
VRAATVAVVNLSGRPSEELQSSSNVSQTLEGSSSTTRASKLATATTTPKASVAVKGKPATEKQLRLIAALGKELGEETSDVETYEEAHDEIKRLFELKAEGKREKCGHCDEPAAADYEDHCWQEPLCERCIAFYENKGVRHSLCRMRDSPSSALSLPDLRA